MDFGMLKIMLIALAAVLYFILLRTLRGKLQRGSRAARFKVGGSRLSIKREEDKEEGRKKIEVNLRGGLRERSRKQ